MSHLIGQVYDAALGDEDWSAALARVRALLGADCAELLYSGGSAENAVHVGCEPADIQAYNDYYHWTSPLLPMMPRLGTGSVVTNHMLVPERDFTRSEFYNDFLRPRDAYSGLCWFDAVEGGRQRFLSLWRSRRWPVWEPSEIRVLRAIGPHLGQALKIERRLAAVSARRSTAIDGDLLAPQERACLAGVARGGSSKLIARQLGLSMHTVNAYLASARRKLKAASRSEAVAIALSAGLIDG
ncbi:response regulator transcription factor [Inquilinus sp. CA228]|uniref:response regulator transcription factor n=1 Tax=Inquilinus sp. CA228 TaxID=3455609 RepID=UPI003F8D1A38